MNHDFWSALDALVLQSGIVVDRPKGSAHPKFPDMIYPLNYGYLKDTASMDAEGIDVWLGSADTHAVGGIICSVDLMKRDSEIKILIGCTDTEMETILQFHNSTEFMKGILVRREG